MIRRFAAPVLGISTVLVFTACGIVQGNVKNTVKDIDAAWTSNGQDFTQSSTSAPVSAENDSYITAEQAKSFALAKAGVSQEDARFLKVELDRDDILYKYDVEFTAQGYEYDIEVSAKDGEILSFDKEKEELFD